MIAENVVTRKNNKIGVYSVISRIKHFYHRFSHKLQILRVADL